MDTCPYHGDLMEKLGELRANQVNEQKALEELKIQLGTAVSCMQTASRAMQKEQLTRNIGKIVLWGGSVTGAIFIAEYVRSCFK